jgi:dihydroneopterin aldolase
VAVQTAVHTSILQKILEYLELASKVAEVIPEPHVQSISLLIDTLSGDLLSKLFGSPHQALQAAAMKAQIVATVKAQAPSGGGIGGATTVKSTF